MSLGEKPRHLKIVFYQVFTKIASLQDLPTGFHVEVLEVVEKCNSKSTKDYQGHFSYKKHSVEELSVEPYKIRKRRSRRTVLCTDFGNKTA